MSFAWNARKTDPKKKVTAMHYSENLAGTNFAVIVLEGVFATIRFNATVRSV